ncbi:hypothetical protein, partial [Acinetobacter baumannii]|uniref:hypothetical protein n=1 Tax=Acinetobacter baumannii TaxID=470 RepID=UPI000810DB5A
MKICIGGDLNGQVVEKDVYSFKATDIDPEKSSEYFKQVYVTNEKIYSFWICKDLSPKEAAKRGDVSYTH